MPSKLMGVFVGFDLVFAACGGLLIGFCLMAEETMHASPTLDNVARNLLLDQCPLTGTIGCPWEERDVASILRRNCGGSCHTSLVERER